MSAIQDREYNKFIDADTSSPSVRTLNNGLLNVAYDYLSVSYPSSTEETYTFKTGGASGTIVRVIDIVYTDSTKEKISTATRSA